MADSTELFAQQAAKLADHLRRYLEDGEKGHFFDTSDLGGSAETPTLLLKTVGRKSGKIFMTPLIYARVGDEYAIAASKGGADEHPAWYLNLTARPEVRFQVINDRFEGSWREAAGDERRQIWSKLIDVHPPYAGYEARTTRLIPVVLLQPLRNIAQL